MAKFKLISGTHRIKGVKYEVGAIIEIDEDLCAKFANKFEAVKDAPKAKPAPKPAPAEVVPAFRIVKAGKRWKVVDGDGNAQHDKTLTKRQAQALVAELTE
jgi:hypothetical protein